MLKFILCLNLLALANTSKTMDSLKGGLVQAAIKDPLINEVIIYKPIKEHHFNLEAPQGCGENSTINATARQITCQFHDSGNKKVRLSVCDNEKKYCKQELIDVSVRPKKSGTPRIKTSPVLETLKMQKKTKQLLMFSFKSMSPDEAKQAVSTKKAAIVLVSTEWCPPCNMVKEFLLPAEEFKAITKDFLLVYVDGDDPKADAWSSILKSRFYPTFVVLNKNLESVGLFSDITLKDFSKKLAASLKVLGDPYKSLETRIKNRLSGNFFQKARDLFKAKSVIESDEKRFLDYLSARGKTKEQIKYIKAFGSEKYKDELLLAQQQDFLFGVQEASLSKEEVKLQRNNRGKTLLSQPIKDKDYYFYVLKSFCESSQNNTLSKECLDYLKNYSIYLDKNRQSHWSKLSQAEQILSEARYFKLKASLSKILENKETTKKYYASCFSTYKKLYPYSPLKEKSRSIRFQQLGCLTDDDSTDKSLKVLTSLVRDYPFEETFQRKLTSYYLKKKDYNKALDYNKKALTYSYGSLWAYNMSLKAKILQGLKQNQEALVTLERALKELVLEKEGRPSKVINMLRSEYEKLKTFEKI